MTTAMKITARIIVGDVRKTLATLPDRSVQCCVTSPPYYGLRDYGNAAQIGLESTPEAYIAEMVNVFREVKRCLRDDGTLWLNIGDSYNGSGKGGVFSDASEMQATNVGANIDKPLMVDSCKAKDLLGVPWMLAFALRADGWYLRQDIIWHKPAPMPESVRDRCTKAHEYIFLMTKSARYFYDADAIAEQSVNDALPGPNMTDTAETYGAGNGGNSGLRDLRRNYITNGIPPTRNARSVWTIGPSPFSEAHFATFPPALPERCILAGTSQHGCCSECGAPWKRVVERKSMVLDRSERTHDRGQTRASGTMLEPPQAKTVGWEPTCKCAAAVIPCTVLDPFGGAGTTGLVAQRLMRSSILCELNPKYAAMAERRIREDNPLFSNVTLEVAA